MGTEKKYIKSLLKTNEQIVEGAKSVALKLNKKIKNDEAVIITVLNGGLPYSMELMKYLTFDMRIDFIVSSSYHLDKQTDVLKTKYEAKVPIKGKHVIIVDDIVDSGKTMNKITKIISAYDPKSITVTAMYGKPKRIKLSCDEEYIWEEDPNGFLLGFGLDYDEYYRNLPNIYLMKKIK